MKSADLLVRYQDSLGAGSRADLTRFMYKGAASLRSNQAYKKIADGDLGRPQPDRLDLLKAFKEELQGRVDFGYSKNSTPHYLVTLGVFLRFLDGREHSHALSKLAANYLEYAEHLFVECRLKGSVLSEESAYHKAATLSSIIGSVLDIHESERLLNRTRLRSRTGSIKAVSRQVEKQDIEATFRQGNLLVDIVEGVTKEAVYESLPLRIPVRAGLIEGDEVLLYASLQETAKPTKVSLELREAVSDIRPGKPPSRRWLLVNMRVQAELLVFIAQTGMNMAQARALQRGTMKYKPLGDSWHVRCYKNRKGGEVSFQIYKSYKPFLENFRVFVNHFFPDSPHFFPQFDSTDAKEGSSRTTLVGFNLVRQVFDEYGVAWVTPREIRNTRINWLLRRSGDAELAAEMAQHTKRVLREKYERPSQQRAMVEVTQFWDKHDPIRKKDLKLSIIASRCTGEPEPVAGKPDAVVEPNCVNPSGCLWCKHHRDVDSEDYVWSLATFRYLKTIEASMAVSRDEVPSDIVVNRLSEKILWFKNSSSKRAGWAADAQERIDEDDYHSNWSPIIELLEQQ